ncbi:MAG TPA: PTS sugar transporter subunit IIA [Gemmatimonadales bacterium]
MLLSDLLSADRIRVPLASRDKRSVLGELIGLVATEPRQADEVLQAVIAREAILSTGIGYGVAVPHGRCDSLPDLRLAAGITPEPIAFDALDGLPVRLFFLIAGPESLAGAHIKALSRITRLVRREPVRQRLLQARSPEEFHRHLSEAEGR